MQYFLSHLNHGEPSKSLPNEMPGVQVDVLLLAAVEEVLVSRVSGDCARR